MKERMRCRRADFKMEAMDARAASSQLVLQPAPFILQLTIGYGDGSHPGDAAQLGSIEAVAARLRFGVDRCQVPVDRSDGRCR